MAGSALVAASHGCTAELQQQGLICHGAEHFIVALPSLYKPNKVNSKHPYKASVQLCAAKPLLDGYAASTFHCTDDILSALERSLLESQWALQYADINPELNPDNSNGTVVRSGKLSARQRRISARTRANAGVGPHNPSSEENDEGYFAERSRGKKGKMKLEPLHDFVTSFLRPTSGCGMFSKSEEQGFTKHMRIYQSLEKAKRKLSSQLGYEPPFELWAQSVKLSSGELLAMLAAGEAARQKMLVSHLRLVVSVAKHYQNLGVDTADLIQEGSMGLLRGLEKFDHRKGYKISTYVHWWIRQGVTRAIAEHSRMVRVPAYLHEIIFAIKRAKAQLILQGKPITVENLSSYLNVPSYRIKKALKVRNKITSMDKTNNSYGLKTEFSGMHEFVPDLNRDNQPWDLLYEEHMIGYVKTRLRYLTPKEQQIMRWLFGIDIKDGARSSLASVGQKLGVSKERIRQMKSTALRKMRLDGGGKDIF